MKRPPRPRYVRPEAALINRNVTALSGRTSLRLEEEFWFALQNEAARRRLTLGEMVRQIERASPDLPRTSAVRVWLLARMRERAETAERAVGVGCVTSPASSASFPPAEIAP